MKTSILGSIAIAFTLAAPTSAHPAAEARPRRSVKHSTLADLGLASATALARLPTISQPSVFPRRYDGLGRSDDECVSGCLDH